MEIQLTAREMFKKLGYDLYLNANDKICYVRIDHKYCIDFFLDDKVFQCYENDFYTTSCSITLEELQAINKQVEELGWNNDRESITK